MTWIIIGLLGVALVVLLRWREARRLENLRRRAGAAPRMPRRDRRREHRHGAKNVWRIAGRVQQPRPRK